MAKLIHQSNMDGNYNNVYEIDIPNSKSAIRVQLISCYLFCRFTNISISDILIETINKNTGYSVAWQSCIRYDLEDFQETFPKIKELLLEYENNKFESWCVIFYLDGKQYSLSGKADTFHLHLHCPNMIDENAEKMIGLLEEELRKEIDMIGE